MNRIITCFGALVAVAALSTGLTFVVATPADAAVSGLRKPHRPARPAEPAWPKALAPVSGVAVFGDSLTVQGTPYLRAHAPGWAIDARWGRGVTELPVRIDAYLASHPLPPKVAVVALGTNEQAGWSEAAYRAAVAKFPERTRVVFVTTWRPNAGVGTPQDGQLYSSWMQHIAMTRKSTAIADWRGAASADATLLSDGLHQTLDRGVQTWGDAVLGAVDTAQALGAAADQPALDRYAAAHRTYEERLATWRKAMARYRVLLAEWKQHQQAQPHH